MKNKIYILFLLFLISSFQVFPWGEEGHQLINRLAIDFLPEEMNSVKQWRDYISEHAPDPDKRRDKDSTEIPKHYIDIDYYKEFQQGKMVIEKAELEKIYGALIVKEMGYLPWATLETFDNLTKAFKDKNRDRILIYATDLGHYVADGHQPMHTILNYDGQLTNQKGIHSRYESKMIDQFLDELKLKIDTSSVKYIENPLSFIFDYISKSNSFAEVLFSADRLAYENAGSRENEEYYNMLWFRTKYITEIQFEDAINSLSSLYYTAWVNAGKPSLENVK